MAALTADLRQTTSKESLFVFTLAAIPWIVSAINPIWLSNKPGDWDVWIYYGYFNHLYQFTDQYIWPATEYLGTRIPYILPGYVFHRLVGDNFFRAIFAIGIVYNTIVFSFYYVLRTHLPLSTAAATTVLIATSFFLLRSIGWDYVDRAVVCYEALTFAFLTKAGRTDRPWLYLIATGFTAASMIFVHLASLMLFPIFFAYYALVIRRSHTFKDWQRSFILIIAFCGMGGVLAQIVWGGLTLLLHGGSFLFIMKQISVVGRNISGWSAPLRELLAHGYWIVPHIAAFIGSAGALILNHRRPLLLTTFEAFWLWVVVIVFVILFLGEVTGYTWILSRAGMHSTILLPISSISIGILLFRAATPAYVAAAIVVGVGSVVIPLSISDGQGLSAFLRINIAILGAIGGIALLIGILTRAPGSRFLALIVIGAISSFGGWRFVDDAQERALHARIASSTGTTLPIVFYSDKDPKLLSIWSVLASFTDRALVPQEAHYPVFNGAIRDGSKIVILTSTIADAGDAIEPVQKKASSLRLLDSIHTGPLHAYVLGPK